MKIQFAIGYLRGGLWALGVGAFASFVLALITLRGEFLWCTLILGLAIGPIFLGIELSTLRARLDRGWSITRAISTPLRWKWERVPGGCKTKDYNALRRAKEREKVAA